MIMNDSNSDPLEIQKIRRNRALRRYGEYGRSTRSDRIRAIADNLEETDIPDAEYDFSVEEDITDELDDYADSPYFAGVAWIS
jgi:hypothetical protein